MKKLILLALFATICGYAFAQKVDNTNLGVKFYTKENIVEHLKDLEKGKAHFLKPTKPAYGGKWLVGKWIDTDNWTDKNDNNKRDDYGKKDKKTEKSEGNDTMGLEFKADGSMCWRMGKDGIPGVPANNFCNYNYFWSNEIGVGGGYFFTVMELVTQRVLTWEIHKISDTSFILEIAPFTKFKKGVFSYDPNKPRDKTLFKKL